MECRPTNSMKFCICICKSGKCFATVSKSRISVTVELGNRLQWWPDWEYQHLVSHLHPLSGGNIWDVMQDGLSLNIIKPSQAESGRARPAVASLALPGSGRGCETDPPAGTVTVIIGRKIYVEFWRPR